jgi:uncharacterized membrane protein
MEVSTMSDALPLVTWLQEFAADILAFVFSFLMVIGYYVHFSRQASKDPTYSIHAVNARARRLWTENVMTNSGKELVAVQTLRNYIMVSIMMASTSALLIMGTLTLSGQAENIVHSWHSLGMFGSHSQGLWIIKVLCLLVDFIVAFFSYAMSMRLATHVLFMLNVPQAGYIAYPELSYENVADRLILSGNMMALGMRAFLFAIPLVFWLFGPVFLFLATIGLVITLNRLDRHEASSSHVPVQISVKPVSITAKKAQGSGQSLGLARSQAS